MCIRWRINFNFYGAGILHNAESCQGVICEKSTVECFANYPLLLFHIPQPKNSTFPPITKLPFARTAQQMCKRCIAVSGVPQSLPSIFFVVHLRKNSVVCYDYDTFMRL